MQRISLAVLAAVGIQLAGCSTPPPLPQAHPLAEARKRALEAKRKEEGVWTNALGNSDTKASPVQLDGFERVDYLDGWCRSEKVSYSRNVVLREQALAEVCREQGGSFKVSRNGLSKMDAFCVAANEPDQVLFAVRSSYQLHNGGCTTAPIAFIRPTQQPFTRGYRMALKEMGFRTEAEASQDARRQADAQWVSDFAAKAEADTERLRLQRDWARMSQRGSAVCRNSKGVTYIAYVEDATSERLKLLISGAHPTQNPSVSVGGFKPSTIWTTGQEWHPCEVRLH